MPIAYRSDRRIQRDVLRALRASGWLRDAEIGVEVDRGVVTLTGTVDTMEKRVAAVQAAHEVAGVLDVADDVDVPYPGSRAQTDADLARAVRNALEDVPRLAADRIQITVADGCVWLEGTVASPAAQRLARAEARRVSGVGRVIDALNLDSYLARADGDTPARERRTR